MTLPATKEIPSLREIIKDAEMMASFTTGQVEQAHYDDHLVRNYGGCLYPGFKYNIIICS